MAVWLNNLTESIEKKYGITNEEPKQRRQLNESVELNEGVELNEALSDLMPDWLKQRILTTKYRYYGNGGKSRRSDKELGIHRGWDINAKNPGFGPQPTYGRRKGDELYQDQDLWSKFLAKGVNLDTVEVISGDIPTKSTDPRLKEPNIPIFLFDNNQVYAKGINDYEETTLPFAANGKQTFGKVSPKRLIDNCIAFAYIDGNDDKNFIDPMKADARKEYNDSSLSDYKNQYKRVPKNEMPNPDVFTRWNQNQGKSTVRWGIPSAGYNRYDIDKSGYIVTDLADKYRDALVEAKVGKFDKQMEKFARQINEFYSTLQSELNNLDVMEIDENGDDLIKEIAHYLGKVRSVASYYNNLKREVENDIQVRMDSWGYEREQAVREAVEYIIRYSSYYREVKNQIPNIEEFIDTKLSSEIDWI